MQTDRKQANCPSVRSSVCLLICLQQPVANEIAATAREIASDVSSQCKAARAPSYLAKIARSPSRYEETNWRRRRVVSTVMRSPPIHLRAPLVALAAMRGKQSRKTAHSLMHSRCALATASKQRRSCDTNRASGCGAVTCGRSAGKRASNKWQVVLLARIPSFAPSPSSSSSSSFA